jgi:uncharacterized protein DUF6152
MKSKLCSCFAFATSFLMFSCLALAHHGSIVSYDMKKIVTMEGTVTEFQWRNPHVYVMYDVKDAQGNVVNWGAETHAPVVCENQDHWTKSTLKPGDKITIGVFPSKLGSPRGLLAKIMMADGTVIIDDTGRGRQAGQ